MEKSEESAPGLLFADLCVFQSVTFLATDYSICLTCSCYLYKNGSMLNGIESKTSDKRTTELAFAPPVGTSPAGKVKRLFSGGNRSLYALFLCLPNQASRLPPFFPKISLQTASAFRILANCLPYVALLVGRGIETLFSTKEQSRHENTTIHLLARLTARHI
jgi:hypothetical protein